MNNVFEANLEDLEFSHYLKARDGRIVTTYIKGRKSKIIFYKDKQGKKIKFFEPLSENNRRNNITDFPDDYITPITHTRAKYNKAAGIKLI